MKTFVFFHGFGSGPLVTTSRLLSFGRLHPGLARFRPAPEAFNRPRGRRAATEPPGPTAIGPGANGWAQRMRGGAVRSASWWAVGGSKGSKILVVFWGSNLHPGRLWYELGRFQQFRVTRPERLGTWTTRCGAPRRLGASGHQSRKLRDGDARCLRNSVQSLFDSTALGAHFGVTRLHIKCPCFEWGPLVHGVTWTQQHITIVIMIDNNNSI